MRYERWMPMEADCDVEREPEPYDPIGGFRFDDLGDGNLHIHTHGMSDEESE